MPMQAIDLPLVSLLLGFSGSHTAQNQTQSAFDTALDGQFGGFLKVILTLLADPP